MLSNKSKFLAAACAIGLFATGCGKSLEQRKVEYLATIVERNGAYDSEDKTTTIATENKYYDFWIATTNDGSLWIARKAKNGKNIMRMVDVGMDGSLDQLLYEIDSRDTKTTYDLVNKSITKIRPNRKERTPVLTDEKCRELQNDYLREVERITAYLK